MKSVIRAVLQLALFTSVGCCVSGTFALDQDPTDTKQSAKRQPGSAAAPIFIKKLTTEEERAASAEEEKERKKKLEIDSETLNVAKEARVAAQDAARYAGYGLLIAFAAAFIAFLQWRMFWRQLFLMRASNRLAMKSAVTSEIAAKSALENVRLTEKQFVTSHRPWIKVKVTLASDLKRDNSGKWSIVFNFHMTNIGNVPAQCVWPHADLYGDEGFATQLLIAQKMLAEAFVPGVTIGKTIFPGDDAEHKATLTIIEGGPLDRHKEVLGEKFIPTLFVVGSVHYKSTFEDTPHRTGFIRELGYHDKLGNKITSIPVCESTSQENLVLFRHVAGDGHID